MVGSIDPSLCPLSWKDYLENVRKAVSIIHRSSLPEDTKETIYELLEVEDISGFPTPEIRDWKDALEYSTVLIPEHASVPEVAHYHNTIELLARGRLR